MVVSEPLGVPLAFEPLDGRQQGSELLIFVPPNGSGSARELARKAAAGQCNDAELGEAPRASWVEAGVSGSRDACDAGPARLERLSAAQPVHRLPLRRLVPSDVRDALRAAQPELAPEKLDQLSRPSTACRWC